MTRHEVSARFRRIATRALAAPDPVLEKLHRLGLGPKPAPYRWNGPAKKGRPKSNGTKKIDHEIMKEEVDENRT
jgi:hypothetical protein